MKREEARRLLDRIGVLKHACDLDLLLFFGRHPRTLLTSEQLAAWLGYELKQIAASLEILLGSGLLTRTQNPTHAAGLYVLAIGPTTGEWLPSLLPLASTREGRLAMLEALVRRTPDGTNGPGTSGALETNPRQFVVPRQSDEAPGAETE